MSSHEIHHLLDVYGLIAVFLATGGQALGPPIPGGTVLVAAAVYASTRHGLPVAGVLAAGALGAFLGTTLAYAVGRWRGDWVVVRTARLARQPLERMERLRERFRSNAAAVLFVGRFITGARNVVGLLAGAGEMPLPRFLAVEAAAATLWSGSLTLEYYFFGHAILGGATWLQVLLVALAVLGTFVTFRLLRARVTARSEA